jgi:hypothetical protein
MVNLAASQSDSVLDDAETLLQMASVGGKLGAGPLCDRSHVLYTSCGVPHMGVGSR